jgi:hypothetical protein
MRTPKRGIGKSGEFSGNFPLWGMGGELGKRLYIIGVPLSPFPCPIFAEVGNF